MIEVSKKFSKLAVLMLVVLVLAGTASAQNPVIAVGSASGAPGTAVNLPVNFTAGAIGVSTLQFDLSLPSGVTSLNPPGIITGSAALAAGKSASASVQPSSGVRVLIFGLNQNTIGNGGLATVNLNIASGTAAGTLTVGISGIVASDAGGNAVATTGTNGSVVVTVPVDTTPPTISGVGSSGVTYNAATISWTTNEISDTQVDYGTTAGYGSSTVLNTAKVTSHSASLSGLTASTTYHYQVKSKDAAGNLATSGDFSFATPAAPDTTPPTISGVGSSGVTANAATVNWTTNEASDTQVEYGTSTAYGSSTVVNSVMVTSHSASLSGLTASTTYHYQVKSKDAAGNLATSGDFTFATPAAPDTTPPTISGVGSPGVTYNAATIGWTTNEASDTQVDYGTTAGYGSSTVLNASMVTSHSASLSSLTASTTYHYRVKSKDAAGNLATSGDFTFATPAAPDTTPPGDVKNFTAGGGDRKISLSWTTPSDSDYKGVLIRYRTDGLFPTTKDDGVLVTDVAGNPNTAQTFVHSGLTNGTTYYYSAFSYDVAQNFSTTAHAQAIPSALTITSISPKQASLGTTVVIAGSGFGSSQGTSTVNFGGLTAQVSSWSDTSIAATVPANSPSGSVIVTVTVNGVQSNGLNIRIRLRAPGNPHVKG